MLVNYYRNRYMNTYACICIRTYIYTRRVRTYTCIHMYTCIRTQNTHNYYTVCCSMYKYITVKLNMHQKNLCTQISTTS